MTGPLEFLVSKTSATHSRPWERDTPFIIAVQANHSSLVKFQRRDPTYLLVQFRVQRLAKDASRLIRETTEDDAGPGNDGGGRGRGGSSSRPGGASAGGSRTVQSRARDIGYGGMMIGYNEGQVNNHYG